MDQQGVSRRRLLFGAGIAAPAGIEAVNLLASLEVGAEGEAPGAALNQVVWADRFNGVRLVAVGLSGWRVIAQQLAGLDWCDMFVAGTSAEAGAARDGLHLIGRPRSFEAEGRFGAVTLIVGDTLGPCGSRTTCAVAEAAARCGHLVIVIAAAPPSGSWLLEGGRFQASLEQLAAVADCVIIDPRAGTFEGTNLRAAALAEAAVALIPDVRPDQGRAGFLRLDRTFRRAGIGDYQQFGIHAFGPATGGVDWLLAHLYGEDPPAARRMLIRVEGCAPFGNEAASRLVALIQDCVPAGEACEWSLTEHPPPLGYEDRHLSVAILRAGIGLG